MIEDDYIEIHIDETGDRGFSSGSSDYFCLAACAFRHSKASRIVSAMRSLNSDLRRPKDMPLHAVKHLKTHDKMMEATEHLAKLPVRLLYVILPKGTVPHELRKGEHIYKVVAGVLLEQMNMFASSVGLQAFPTFAVVKGMPRSLLDSHIATLRLSGTQLQWLRLPVAVCSATEKIGLQWGDIAGRALHKAINPSSYPPYRTEPAYLQGLARIIWRQRPIQNHGILSLMYEWHAAQPWWAELRAAIPLGDI
ncbi:MAG: hypothetical protein OXD37_09790 [Acidimicrobiaceae bacterium]|nr:hypothetical protein [Acidimicrobiaceae bacterium]